MSEPGVTVELDDRWANYLPGDNLSGWYRLTKDEPRQIHGMELTVLWRTSGKGDEDVGVHFFEKLTSENDLDSRDVRRFSTRLPATPLSYDGLILQILWCVRVRAFVVSGPDLIGETRFRLGNVPPPRQEPV